MKTFAGALGLLALATVGCGKPQEMVFACILGTGTSQVCVETTTEVNDQNECGAGTLVEACPREGADGGCVSRFASEGGPLTQTVWYYSGTSAGSAQEMTDCTNTGGTWIVP